MEFVLIDAPESFRYKREGNKYYVKTSWLAITYPWAEITSEEYHRAVQEYMKRKAA